MKTQAPKLNRQILAEASAWFVDFRVGDVDSQARERFDEWLRRSPEHIRAYMEIAKAYATLPALTQNRNISVQELIAYARSEGNVVPFDQPTPTQPTSAPRMPGSTQRHGPWSGRGLLAASIVLVCTTAGVATWLVTHRYPTYATGVGEHRSITLSDGSTIDLNARSKVRIRFSKAEREVLLVDGQALFEVAKDAARPFVVHSGTAVVRAVGTQFDVYHKKSGTRVTVIEGRVTVAHEHSLPRITTSAVPSGKAAVSEPTFVSAGEQVTITDRTVPKPNSANVAAATAWMQRQLIFDGDRLGEVAEDFNRYNTRQILIDDQELRDFHVSGVYSSTDSASFIRFLREQPGVRVIETDEDIHVARQ